MARYGKGACPHCRRMCALTADQVVWRHDDPEGKRTAITNAHTGRTESVLISCPGSWQKHVGGPTTAPAVQPPLPLPLDDLGDTLFDLGEAEPPGPRLLAAVA